MDETRGMFGMPKVLPPTARSRRTVRWCKVHAPHFLVRFYPVNSRQLYTNRRTFGE